MDANILKYETTRKVWIDKLERIKAFVDNKLAGSTSTYAKVRLEALEATFEQFNATQSALEQLVEETTHTKIRAEFEETYYELKPGILDHISVITPIVKNENQPTVSQGNVIAKLPRIEINVFSGDFTKWLDFYNTFDILVNKNSQLNILSKFQHLRNSVDGAAAELISLKKDQLNLLKERYNNSKIICRDHMRKIFEIQRIIKPSAEKLSELINQLNSNLRSLKSLDRPTQYWDDLLIEIILPKLDPYTVTKWEDEEPVKTLPTLEEFLAFLNKRLHALEGRTIHNIAATSGSQSIGSRSKPSRSSYSATVGAPKKLIFACAFCQIPGHRINQCRRFLRLSIPNRRQEINKLRICINCLRNDHQINNCTSPFHCNKPGCSIRHHSLVHADIAQSHHQADQSNNLTNTEINNRSVGASDSTKQNELTKNTVFHSTVQDHQNISHIRSSNAYVFFAIALVIVLDHTGSPIIARALLDSGSQLSLMTEKFAARLGLRRKNFSTAITGIGASSLSCHSMLAVTIQSRINAYTAQIDVHLLPKISGPQPTISIKTSQWMIPQNIRLADPEFSTPQHIDLLIGADLYYSLQAIGQIQLGPDMPILQNTLLGWVVVGKTENYCSSPQNYHVCNTLSIEEISLNEQLRNFFEIEHPNAACSAMSKQEQYVEDHFEKHYARTATGKFIVKLPMSQPVSVLGNSQDMARRRFNGLEHRLNRNDNLKKVYQETIEEYLELGHMKQVTAEEVSATNFFLPHHCVLKPDSYTTKMRIVFDASAKSDSGEALNDILMVGPVLQQDLFSILARFRTYEYVFSADICKMYRQIVVTDDDAQLQHIFWRKTPSETLKMFRLLTLTFGTASASYLATKCVQKLAEIHQERYPLASQVMMRDVYIDDILTGSNNFEEAKTIITQISKILSTAGMKLRKWCANSQDILEGTPQEHREKLLQLENGDFIKTLEMYWQPSSDIFCFNVQVKDNGGRVTKRTVLSDIARIFNPLGLTSPSLPQDLFTVWKDFRNQLTFLNDLQVSRRITLTSIGVVYELHGFADASEKAFGAAIYLRSQSMCAVNVQLICAKSRVAPLSKTTIPRLELCAALLLAELVRKVIPVLNINIHETYYWSDSAVALTTIAGNRVAKIQRMTAISNWHHISTKFNSADLLSRGCSPLELIWHSSWFTGPSFLQTSPDQWPTSRIPVLDDGPERRKTKAALACSSALGEVDLLQRFQSRNFLSLQRIMAYVHRFIHNYRSREENDRIYGDIEPGDLQNGLNLIIKIMQSTGFKDQMVSLRTKRPLNPKDPLIPLSPFLDISGILRVGGRLKHSSLAYSTKYPILLPSTHPITSSIPSYFHKKLLHAGPQALLAAMCKNIFCDNGTNFVAANSSLHELYQLFKTQHCNEGILRICQDGIINWRFAPPLAPHFGGIYEAAVKSAKHHLRRIMGDSSLTYEEMNTAFKQVEAVLNSRPLTPLSSDPNDLEAITPGHFLVGRPLTAIMEPNIENEKVPYLKRWCHVQQLHQHFWSRWTNEYLLGMQQRRKWSSSSRNIAVGELVLIKEDNLPSLRWKMGRVLEVHPGNDKLVRVVTLKTQGGIIKRPVTKICPFPSMGTQSMLKAGIQGGDDG